MTTPTARPSNVSGAPRTGTSSAPSAKLKSAALRALLVGAAITTTFLAVAIQLVHLAMSGQNLPRAAPAEISREFYSRPDIVDRNGRLLAADVGLPTLFADPFHILSVDETIEKLSVYFPELDSAQVRSALSDRKRRYYALKHAVAPGVAQQIHNLGLPGIEFKDEPKRSYPAGRLAGHVLGYVNGQNYGVAGIERRLNAYPGVGRVHSASVNTSPPMRLTLDVRAQYGLKRELATAIKKHRAEAATGIIIDVDNGEIRAAASLPGVDPSITSEVLDKTRRNRFADDAFELGSVFKVFTLAMVLDQGVVTPNAMIDVSTPLQIGRFRITDDHPVKGKLTLDQVFIRSSNIGAGALAQATGRDRQREFLNRVGLTRPLNTTDVKTVAPKLPQYWGKAETVTIGYGHGIAVSPLQFTVAFASVINGGYAVVPTMTLRQDRSAEPRKRIMKSRTSAALRRMLRKNVLQGTGRRARAKGYRVGGKTGTADLARNGRYDGKSVITTFAAAFPMDQPRYAIVVTLFDPKPKGGRQARTAGRTAAPVAGVIIERVAPMLGVKARP